ncbi:MAG: diphthamide biosynthesis enzyme Dph2 [Nanoarchaeota archaeon]|nr:diphthamide biosynthesis enzyme Dph2 [Nanoarchaeota archaeon]MBU2458928.1 diphthamide biosynthesis enzyme Dph2 [Nanoarchaeota archaeon]
MVLDFEKEKLIRELKKRKPNKVLVQLAEGIKQNAPEISEVMESLGIECIFSGETCWGGCSVAVQEAEALGVDLIVHFGHAQFIETDFPALYIEVKDLLNLNPVLKKSVQHFKEFETIGLSFSVQHKHDLEKIKKFYEDLGKKVILSKKAGHVAYEGHIVGCQYEGLKAIENEVDAFVIFGNQFHSMGATLAVKKPVILIDVYNDDVRNMKGLRDKILKQRVISIDRLRDAKNVGVIIEVKLGQKFGSPKKILQKLRDAGKNAILITMSELTPDKIMNFYSIDAFIELACPRIAIDDFAKYSKPILTLKEALVALGEKSWDDILETGII